MTKAASEARGAIHYAKGMPVAAAGSSVSAAIAVVAKAKVNIKIATELLKNFTFSTPLELNYSFFTHTRRIDKFARSLIKKGNFSSILCRES